MSVILWVTTDVSNGQATCIFRVEDRSTFLRNVGNNPEDDLYIFTVTLNVQHFPPATCACVFCLMVVVRIKENGSAWAGIVLSVQQLVRDWTVRESKTGGGEIFRPQGPPDLCTMSTGSLSLDVVLTTHPI